jgi:hypothetical protein
VLGLDGRLLKAVSEWPGLMALDGPVCFFGQGLDKGQVKMLGVVAGWGRGEAPSSLLLLSLLYPSFLPPLSFSLSLTHADRLCYIHVM